MSLISTCLIVQLLTVGRSMQSLIKASLNLLYNYSLSVVLCHKSLNICQMVGLQQLDVFVMIVSLLNNFTIFLILPDDSLDLELIDPVESRQDWHTCSKTSGAGPQFHILLLVLYQMLCNLSNLQLELEVLCHLRRVHLDSLCYRIFGAPELSPGTPYG